MTTDFAAVVRRHWNETTAYLVAGREPCIRVARDEVRHVRRRFVFVNLDVVADLEPDGSWFMGVVVCKQDDLAGLADWARSVEAHRVHFYLHKDAHPRQLVPWRDVGLPLDRVEQDLASWKDLHKVLGWDLNVQVYDDHAPR